LTDQQKPRQVSIRVLATRVKSRIAIEMHFCKVAIRGSVAPAAACVPDLVEAETSGSGAHEVETIPAS
jgi:hypothetical protein